MYSENELERLHSFFTDPESVWTLILQYLLEHKKMYTDQLIQTDDSINDSLLKGRIRCIEQDIETMPNDFKKLFENLTKK